MEAHRAMARLRGEPVHQMAIPDDELCVRCNAMLDFDIEGRLVAHQCCVCRDTKRVRVVSDRHDPQFGKTVPCQCTRDVDAWMDFESMLATVPPLYQQTQLAHWLPPTGRPRLAAESYVARWEPEKPLLTFLGDVGTGKTMLAVGILRAAYEQHRVHGKFLVVGDLLWRLRQTMRDDSEESLEQVMRYVQRLPLLVLDDIGTHAETPWVQEQLFRAVNQRYSAGLLRPTVFTCNPAGWDSLPDQVRSRLMDTATGEIVRMTGPDRRGQR